MFKLSEIVCQITEIKFLLNLFPLYKIKSEGGRVRCFFFLLFRLILHLSRKEAIFRHNYMHEKKMFSNNALNNIYIVKVKLPTAYKPQPGTDLETFLIGAQY